MDIFAAAIDYFIRGGFCMWPLLICSIVVIVIGVERHLYYKKAISSTEFAIEFCSLMNEFDLNGARELASNTKGDAAGLAAEILDKKDSLHSRLENVVYAKADRAIDGMQRHLNYLNVMIGLAPMLGLLGTITGMIASFNALNERIQNPMAVTSGIGEALITTVFGLIIAIMGMCIYAYLSKRLKNATLDMDEVAGTLVDIVSATRAKTGN